MNLMEDRNVQNTNNDDNYHTQITIT